MWCSRYSSSDSHSSCARSKGARNRERGATQIALIHENSIIIRIDAVTEAKLASVVRNTL